MTKQRDRSKSKQPQRVNWTRRRISLVIFAAVAVLIWVLTAGPKLPPDKVVWGVTWSNHEAEDLHIDPQAAYLAMIDDLHPKRLRLAAYWNVIEAQRDHFDFHELDFQVSEAEKHDIPYVIVIGRKLPRWPECYAPDWALKLPAAEQEERLKTLMEQTIRRYDSHSLLVGWQVENEPYLPFGTGCPKNLSANLGKEVSLVRSMSGKSIRLTDSGEFSTWFRASRYGDVFGTTLYRIILQPNGSLFRYFWWPDFYTGRANIIKKLHPNIKSVVVSELQAEPWGLVPDKPQSYYDRTMSHEQFLANINFAKQTGLDEADLWGVEWWYYEKQHGDSFYWDAARDLFAHSPD